MVDKAEKLLEKQAMAEQDFSHFCSGEISSQAKRGIELFNSGLYWEAHEALEDAWMAETGPIRHLYKGILQAGVMYLQIERGNFIGMAKMYERARKWLAPWPNECRHLNIQKLRQDMQQAIEMAGKLGPEHLGEFDRDFLKNIDILD